MITNVRIGNDIKLMWQILEGETPVNLTNATDIKVSIAQGGIPSCDKIEITTFEVTDAVNGMISVEVQKEVITKLGYLWAVLEYTVPDSGMIDGNRKVTTDNLPVKIVGLTDEASQDYEFTVSSDILAGFQGLSAYEVWLIENPDKTKEDYFNWLQKPATDIAETVGLQEQARIEAENTRKNNEEQRVEAENTRKNNEEQRVEAELLRQSSTQESISNAESATESANTAAQNADDARLAIQDDLALKANHGYGEGEEPKTLKEVEDNASVKIENLVVNGDFRNGTAGWSGSSSISVVDGWLEVTSTSVASRAELFIPNIPIGSKIYVQLKSQPSDYLAFEIWETGGIQTWINAATGGKFSAIRTTTTNTTIRLNTFQNAIGRIAYIGDVMLINLTATFGAGNEPTKEEMDLLISTLGTDYFEGEITIPAQKIMQWQLKLIRKNKNAIIVLGGTII